MKTLNSRLFNRLGIAVALSLALTACGSSGVVKQQEAETPAPKPTPTPAPTPTPTPTPSPSPTPPAPKPVPLVELTLDAKTVRGAASHNLATTSDGKMRTNLNVFSKAITGFDVKNVDAFVLKKDQELKKDGTKSFKVAEDFTVDVSKSSGAETVKLKLEIDDGSGTKSEKELDVTRFVARYEAIAGIDKAKKVEGKEAVMANIIAGKIEGISDTDPKDHDFAIAYIAGNALKDYQVLLDNYPTGAHATYEGDAHYAKKGSSATETGSAKLVFDFKNKEVKSAEIKVPNANIDFSFNEASFRNGLKKDQPQSGDPAGSTIDATPPSYVAFDSDKKAQLRGYFYGDKGEFTAGTFHDDNGAGAFIATDENAAKGSTSIKEAK